MRLEYVATYKYTRAFRMISFTGVLAARLVDILPVIPSTSSHTKCIQLILRNIYSALVKTLRSTRLSSYTAVWPRVLETEAIVTHKWCRPSRELTIPQSIPYDALFPSPTMHAQSTQIWNTPGGCSPRRWTDTRKGYTGWKVWSLRALFAAGHFVLYHTIQLIRSKHNHFYP